MIWPRMPPARAACIALVAPALALAGCGQDEPVRAADGVVRLTLDEYLIAPQEVAVPTGRVRLVVRNDGRLAHDLKLVVPAEEPGDRPRELGGVPTLAPGETGRARVTVRRPAELELVCTLANHDDLGQYGTLVVRAR